MKDGVWARVAEEASAVAGITVAPLDAEGKGDGPWDPRSGFVRFVILQLGAGHCSLARGRKHIKKKINEDP